MGLAYEIVINSNPCIAYLMEENTMTMQALVIAHAGYGHNCFFKGNYLFRSGPTPTSIIDYLVFARHYVAECEERHGVAAVEDVLDSCHALMNHGVDRYRRPAASCRSREETRAASEREAYAQRSSTTCGARCRSARAVGEADDGQALPDEPQENLLYFIEKNAPLLEPWQREIVRIVRKIAQYFYPQRQTQVMNEGWATFWHYTLLNTLYDDGQVTDGVHDRVPEVAHQRGLPAAGRPPRLQRHQPVRARLRDVHRHPAHLREPDRRRPRVVPRHRRRRLAARCSTTRCATSRTRASSASTCRRS